MEQIPSIAGVLIALCIASVLGLRGKKLEKERPGLIVIAIFSLWSLAVPFVTDLLQYFVSDLTAQQITTGLSGILLFAVAWVRIHAVNQWRFKVIFWPTAIITAIIGLGVLFLSMGGQWPEITQKFGAYTLILVCVAQTLVLIRRASQGENAS